MMKARIAELIGIGIIGVAILLPAPRINVHSPRLLYGMALYKAAIGDTGSAVRLLNEADARGYHVAASANAGSGSACQEQL